MLYMNDWSASNITSKAFLLWSKIILGQLSSRGYTPGVVGDLNDLKRFKKLLSLMIIMASIRNNLLKSIKNEIQKL